MGNNTTIKRLASLDVLRFFAAISVVLYHYTARHEIESYGFISEITKFGYLGVPLFFIISGYVISLSANNRTPAEFLVSRFVRLYPAFWVGILFTIAIQAFYGKFEYSLPQIITNFTMLNSYFGYESVDGVYWTLLAELKFYACIFLLLQFNLFNHHKIWLTLWTLMTFIHLMTNQPSFMGWFISPYYSSFFIGGVVLYLVQKQGMNLFNGSILSSSLLMSCVRGFEQVSSYIISPTNADRYIAVLTIVSIYLVCFLLVTQVITLSKRKAYLTIGGLTYPLYLIHNTAGKTIIDSLTPTLPSWLAVTATLCFIITVSLLIHVWIERKYSTPLKIYLLAILSYLRKKQ